MNTLRKASIQVKQCFIAFLGVFAVLFSPFASTGCSVLPGINAGVMGTPKPSAGWVEPIVVAHRPYVTAETWFDITSSMYPSAYFSNALQSSAHAIDLLVQPNEDGATIYVSWISHNSFRSESTVMVISLPSLPADPPRPQLLATPPATGDPYQDVKNKQQVTDENDRRLQAWQQTLLKNHAFLANVRAQVRRQTDQLRHLSPLVDNQGTDIHGALELAGMRLQNVSQGLKYLVLETDLEENVNEQAIGHLDLAHVHVKVFFHPCEDASTCQTNNAYWQQIFSQAGVKDVSLVDPAQSLTMQNLFS